MEKGSETAHSPGHSCLLFHHDIRPPGFRRRSNAKVHPKRDAESERFLYAWDQFTFPAFTPISWMGPWERRALSWIGARKLPAREQMATKLACRFAEDVHAAYPDVAPAQVIGYSFPK